MEIKSHSLANIIGLIVFIITVGIFVVYYRGHETAIFQGYTNIMHTLRPCASPIPYSIGKFDPKFGLTRQELLDDTEYAVSKWEEATGKDLFVYNETGYLKVNLTYDSRQKTTDTLDALDGDIDSIRARYSSLEFRYQSLEATYQQEKSLFDNMVREYKSSHGRSGVSVESIRIKEAKLNTLVGEINKIVPELNTLAKQLNLNINKYNSVGAASENEFDAGEYISDATGTSINVYEFTDKSKLIRLLEHELGHALGLEHIDNPDAIMYYLNNGTSEELDQSDISAIRTECRIK